MKMSKKERQAFVNGVKITLASIAFIACSIAYIVYAVYVY